jgi:hypothetical protein
VAGGRRSASTGEEFIRPAGTDGSADTLREASIWRIDLNATMAEANVVLASYESAGCIGDVTLTPVG